MITVVFSLLGAAAFYLAWLSAFLLAVRWSSTTVEAILWLLAPVITAAGFAAGIAVRERLGKTKGTDFLRIFIWPLVGCAAGAAAVFWFGPMLIVFGMFGVGTGSVVLREVIMHEPSGQA